MKLKVIAIAIAVYSGSLFSLDFNWKPNPCEPHFVSMREGQDFIVVQASPVLNDLADLKITVNGATLNVQTEGKPTSCPWGGSKVLLPAYVSKDNTQVTLQNQILELRFYVSNTAQTFEVPH